MDFNKDGKLDIVSGCFEGFVYVLYGQGEQKFAAPERLQDTSGTPVQLGEFWDYDGKEWGETKGEDPTRDLCVYPVALDWDHDGDLDLLLGGYRGKMAVRINEGSSQKPLFATANTPIEADGKQLTVAGGAASPAVADWDGDGRWDLVCGSSDGSVVWYRNSGTLGEAQFESARMILEAPGDDDKDRPCSYLRVAVGDVNGDKKLDLVVGAKDGARKGAIWIYPRK